MNTKRWLALSLCLFFSPLAVGAEGAGKDEPLPRHAVQRLGTSAFRTGHHARSLTVSPDGKYLASAGFDTPLLFDASTGHVLRKALYYYPNEIAFTNDSTALLVSGSGDHGARRLDLEGEKDFRNLLGKVRLSRSAFSRDRTLLALFNDQAKDIEIWDLETGKLRKSWPAPGNVWSLAWSRDASSLGAVAAEQFLVWDARTGKETLRLGNEKPGWGVSVAFSPTENVVALSPRWGDVLLIDAGSGKTLQRLSGHKSYLGHVAFSPDGKTVAVSGSDGAVGLWETASGKQVFFHKKAHPNGSAVPTFSADSKRLFSGGEGIIRVWDAATGKALDDEDAPQTGVYRLAFTPDGQTLLATHQYAMSRFWDLQKDTHRASKISGLSAANHFSFSRDGKRLLWSVDGRVRISDVAEDKELLKFDAERAHTGRYQYVCAWGKDDKTVVAGGDDYAIHIFDSSADKTLQKIKGVTPSISGLSVSRDGSMALFGEGDGNIALLDLAKGEVRWRSKVEWYGNGAYFSTFSPDGRWVATQSANQSVVVKDTATGNRSRSVGEKWAGGNRCSFSPDARMLVSTQRTFGPHGIPVWELASRQVRLELKGHRGEIVDVAFSPDGTLIASGAADTSVLLWDVTGKARWGDLKDKLSDKQLEEEWEALAGDDAVRAFEAIQKLVLSRQAPAFLKTRLEPVTDKFIWEKIGDLGDDLEEGRARAEQELRELGPVAERPLKEASEKQFPSAAAVKRIPDLIKNLDRSGGYVPKGDRLRYLRAIEVLEHTADGEARGVLDTLAGGLPEAEVTLEAQQALERMAARRAPGGK
jgi:WD40 repeat protein